MAPLASALIYVSAILAAILPLMLTGGLIRSGTNKLAAFLAGFPVNLLLIFILIGAVDYVYKFEDVDQLLYAILFFGSLALFTVLNLILVLLMKSLAVPVPNPPLSSIKWTGLAIGSGLFVLSRFLIRIPSTTPFQIEVVVVIAEIVLSLYIGLKLSSLKNSG